MPCPMSLPPGPTPSPEELWRLEQQPSMLEEFRAAYGDMFTLHRRGRPPRVFISDPRLFRAILLDHDDELACLGPTIYNDLIGPQSMMKLDGAEHRRVRQITTPPLAGANLRRHEGMVHRRIAEGLREVRGCPPQPLARLMVRITARITLALVFPNLDKGVGDAMEGALVGALNALHDARTADPGLRVQLDAEYRYRRLDLDQLVFAEIAGARGTVAEHDAEGSVLAALLAAPEQLSDDYIRDQILTVLTGGTTTSANGICMALYWVHRRPDVAARVSAEVGTLPSDASVREIAALPYVTAVCREALRVPTVTPTSAGRRVVKPFTVDGFHFSEGTEVIIAIHLAHHDESTWSDHDEFRPERFLEGSPGPRYLPFGIGAHRCLGAQLTELEMKIALVEAFRIPDFGVLGADEPLLPRSHGVNLTTPHSLRAYCPAQPVAPTGGTSPGSAA